MYSSTSQVDARHRLAELQSEHARRRRTSAAGGTILVGLAIAGAAWFGPGIPSPATNPPATAVGSEIHAPPSGPGTLVGGGLGLGLVATVPKGFLTACDCNDVTLIRDRAPWGSLVIETPIAGVYNPSTGTTDAPPSDYVAWLREHAWLEVLAERTVTVDGHAFPQVTVRVRNDARDRLIHDLRLVRLSNLGGDMPYTVVRPGQVFSETVLKVDGSTILVRALPGEADIPDQLATGLDALLQSMTW